MNRFLLYAVAFALPWLGGCSLGPGSGSGDDGAGPDGSLPGSDGGHGIPPGTGSDGGLPTDGEIQPPDSCVGISATAAPRLLPVDIVWAIDVSGSMASSFPSIKAALNRFSTDIEAAGIDVHIVLLAGQDLCVPAPVGSGKCGTGSGATSGTANRNPPTNAPDTYLPRFLHLDVPFGLNMGMGVILDNHPFYRSTLRPDAHTQFVLTEDGAPPMSAQAVVDQIEGRSSATTTPAWSPGLAAGSWTFNGVVCKNGWDLGACLVALQIPETTLQLVQTTGGVLDDLAQVTTPGSDPFANVLQALATKVITGAEISCQFDIPPAPAGMNIDPNLVNVQYGLPGQAKKFIPRSSGPCGGGIAWSFDHDVNPTRIVLCPSACEEVRKQKENTLAVQFGCESQIQ